jgi:hypothetical protein
MRKLIIGFLLIFCFSAVCVGTASANFFSDTYNLIKLLPKLNWKTVEAMENLQQLIPGSLQIDRIRQIAGEARRTRSTPSPDDIRFIKSVMPAPGQIDQLIKKTPTNEELNAFIGVMKRLKESLPALANLPKPIRDRIPLPTPAEIANIKQELPNPKVLDLVHANFPSPIEITYLREHAKPEYKYLIPTYEQLLEWKRHIPTGNQIRAILKYLPTEEEIRKIKS